MVCWCSFQGWDVCTLSNTLSGCVTQDPRVGSSEACTLPVHVVGLYSLVEACTLPVHVVACMSEA